MITVIKLFKHVIYGNIIDGEFRFHEGYYVGTDDDKRTHWCVLERKKKATKYPCRIVIPYCKFNHYNPEYSIRFKI